MSDNEEKYDLYTEKIKEKPSVKYKKTIRAIKHVFLVILFGIVAGVSFAAVFYAGMRYGDKEVQEKRDEVTIPTDVYPDEESTQETESNTDELSTQEEITTLETGTEGMSESTFENASQNATQGASKEETQPDEDKAKENYFKEYYAFVKDTVNEAKKSIITVTAVYEAADPIVNIIEKQDDYAGLVIADNSVELLILTSYSPIMNANQVKVTFSDGTSANAQILDGNKTTDLAVIGVRLNNISASTKKTVEIATLGNSYMIGLGDALIALGDLYSANHSMDLGIATNVTVTKYDTDASYRLIYTSMNTPADSNGFVFNIKGEVVGVITHKYDSDANMIVYGISDLKELIQSLSNAKDIAYLGVIGQDITQEVADRIGVGKGVYVTTVEEDSPAFKAGIQNGDIITAIGTRNITTMTDVKRALCEYSYGSMVNVTVQRMGKSGYVTLEFNVTLGVK